MKSLTQHITEKLVLNSNSKIRKQEHNYHPKTRDELEKLIEQLIKERGNEADLNDIDVSEITDMSNLFSKLDPHNIDISEWNVSNVKFMESMFYNCDGLTSINISANVTSIGSAAFRNCDGLTSVTIGDGVTSIGEFAFAYCYMLTSVTIGNSVTAIGSSAFSFCRSLKSIIIPDNVTSTAKTPATKKYFHLSSPAVSPADPIVKNATPGKIKTNV